MSSSSKTLSLNISERLAVVALLNSFKGSLSVLAFILKDIQTLTLTEEDKAKSEFKIVDIGNGQQQYQWNDTKAGLKEIEFASETIDFLKAEIDNRNKEGSFSLQDRPLISFKEKLTA